MKKIPNNIVSVLDLGFRILNLFRISIFEFRISRAARGFTILFAVLVGGLLFSIGLAIAHLAIREVILGTAGRESNYAFFAADSGIECALYWDINVGREEIVFPSSDTETGRSSISCNGSGAVSVSTLRDTSTAATSTFSLIFSPKGCAVVVVGKTVSGFTVVESRGRNDCGAGVNPARVERALRVRY
ncbi:MAG: hypothetical protein AAB891_01330 [Patescibacteria group bacterium]